MFFQQLVNGIIIGGIYALIAIGFSMVYGILRIVNFAHGDIFMMGAFLGMILTKAAGVPYMIAFPFAALCTAGLGICVERFAYRPIRVADRLATLISAMGVSIMLTNIAQLIFGTQTHTFGSNFIVSRIKFGSIIVTNFQLYMLIISALLMVALFTIVQRTKLGVAMRATSHSIKYAKLMGINTNRIISIAFAVGSALAAISGIMVGIYYDAVYPAMGYSYGLKAFSAAILGGIGSIPGAVLGGLIIGVVESLGAAYISSGYRDAFAFGILIVVLIFKPTGILGKSNVSKV